MFVTDGQIGHTSNMDMEAIVDGLSILERQQLAAHCLRTVPAGYQPLELFAEIARISVLSTVELVAVVGTAQQEDLSVLLIQRPMDDRWWPGLWHLPGSVLLSSDHTITTVAERIVERETTGSIRISSPAQQYTSAIRHGARGTELTAFCWAPATIIAPLPQEVAVVPLTTLLTMPLQYPLIDGHLSVIREALQAMGATE
jgi:hypothetical protein